MAVATIFVVIAVSISSFLFNANCRIKNDLRDERLSAELLLGKKLDLEKELDHSRKEIVRLRHIEDSLERRIAGLLKLISEKEMVASRIKE